MDHHESKTEELRRRIDQLPRGYISRKVINGRERFYLQWREGGKIRSRYIKSGELEAVKAALSARKAAEEELRRAQLGLYVSEDVEDLWTPLDRHPLFLIKWEDQTIGMVRADHSARFSCPDYNSTVLMYTKGCVEWPPSQFRTFLSERIFSPQRKDVEDLLMRCGLREYDVFKISEVTRAVNAKDCIWLAASEDERFEKTVSDVFDSIFFNKTDKEGASLDTPEGVNVKRYGVLNGSYGIFKRRLSPLSCDPESELAVSMLGNEMGIPCCRVYRAGNDTVFSRFEYDFPTESILHFRYLLPAVSTGDLFHDLVSARPGYLPDIVRMIVLDLLTRQDDRHMSNLAVKIGPSGESFYPLYDNGRSLFYEDTEETVNRAVGDIPGLCTAFGPSGSYLDHVQEIRRMGIDISRLVDLNISELRIRSILEESGFTSYRLEGAFEWIRQCVRLIRQI